MSNPWILHALSACAGIEDVWRGLRYADSVKPKDFGARWSGSARQRQLKRKRGKRRRA